MRKTTIKDHLEQEQIRKEMQGSETREQFQRWQAIYLLVKGLRVEQVAEYVGVAKGTIHQWVFQYNHQGPGSCSLQGRGGRRFGIMSVEEKADLLEGIRAEAERGEIVGAFSASGDGGKKAGP